jgi:hypothetical protein
MIQNSDAKWTYQTFRPQPNSGKPRDDEAEKTESVSAGKEYERQANKPECPESENDRQESVHGRNAPDVQDDHNGCI